jgi:hypothetical protein
VGEFGEGPPNDITKLFDLLDAWNADEFSFAPDNEWLKNYRESFENDLASSRKHDSPPEDWLEPEDDWLRNGDWNTYFNKLIQSPRVLKLGLQNCLQGYHGVLDAAQSHLPVPWHTELFADRENRRILLGKKNKNNDYGWLGHVGARGYFQGLLANGPLAHKQIIVDSINAAAASNQPINYQQALSKPLDDLISLGYKMNVWGRLLCLVRPDIFTTVSSDALRSKLAAILQINPNALNTRQGYLHLLQVIHGSRWFNSARPANPIQAVVWDRRAAFLDVILS